MSVRILLLLLLVVPRTATAEDAEVEPRAIFLRGLEALEESSKKTFVTDLSKFIETELARPLTSPSRNAERERRRSLVIGLSALFDSTDVLLTNPFSRPFFQNIVQGEDEQRRRRHLGGWVRFHGRNDAVAHFFLSAALTVLAGPVIAERLGHNKEVADAKRLEKDGDGEGFSFRDLAYNQAGIRFACWLVAWGEPTRLRKRPPPLPAFLPSFDDIDLPDRLTWTGFNDAYWGDEVDRFDAVMKEIRTALDRSLEGFSDR